MMTHLISSIMLAYRMLHPEVRFENLSAEHRVSLEKGEADIAFRATNGELGGDALISVRLPSITWGVYCSEAYVERHGRPQSINDLKDHAIVAYSGLVTTLHFSVAFMSFVPKAKVATTCNSIPNMTGAVQPRVRSFMPFAAERIRHDTSGGLRN